MSEQPLDAGEIPPLPVRPASARRSFPPAASMLVQAPYDADTLTRSLREIHGGVDRISGLLVATRDGLVISSDTHGIENDSVAAMAAAAMGLTAQFTGQARIGEPRAAMFEGVSGYVCVFPVEETILLVVFGEPDITMGLFNIAAKQALSLLQQTILRSRVHDFRSTRRAYFEDPADEFGASPT